MKSSQPFNIVNIQTTLIFQRRFLVSVHFHPFIFIHFQILNLSNVLVQTRLNLSVQLNQCRVQSDNIRKQCTLVDERKCLRRYDALTEMFRVNRPQA